MLYYKVAYNSLRAPVLGMLALTYNPDTRKQLGLSANHIDNQSTLNKTHLTCWYSTSIALSVHVPWTPGRSFVTFCTAHKHCNFRMLASPVEQSTSINPLAAPKLTDLRLPNCPLAILLLLQDNLLLGSSTNCLLAMLCFTKGHCT